MICTGQLSLQDIHSTKCTECQEFVWVQKGLDEFLKAKLQWRDAEHRGAVAGLRNPSAVISWSEGRLAGELFLRKLPVLCSSLGILPWPLPGRVQPDF